MKRSWSTTLLIAGLVGLLAVLGALQYRWLSRISESDGERAHKRVQEQADGFAMDFNREIQNAYFNFQTEPVNWKDKDWTAFNERYDFWREKTTYPDLITDFYFFEAKSEAPPLKYDRAARTFAPADLTPELADLKTRFSDEKTFRSVYDDLYTLVLPVHNVEHDRVMLRSPMPNIALSGDQPPIMPDRYGYLLIRLDSSTIRERVLPDLNEKYFGDGEYRAAVVDRSGQSIYQNIPGGESDAIAGLLDLAPENYLFYANKDLISTIGREKKADVILNSRIESHSLNHVESTGDNRSTMKIEVKRDAPRTSVFTTTATTGGGPGLWTLEVQHSSGSLDGFIASTLRRNLATGLGLLLLVAAAIIAIIITANRSRRLAQRQVDFVSSVSHEFRTPLAVIYSAGENLADGVAKEDAQVSRYGELIKGEGRKLSAMVEQILGFAGANSGKQRYNLQQVSAAEVVADAVGECRPLIDEKNIDVQIEIGETLPAINADRRALSRAIQNLIANSIKYSDAAAWLRVTAVNGDGRVKISVEDSGMGISKSDLRQIFEPFYRSKEVVDAQIHGNGLGLSLVRQIVQAHGGSVRAESEIGKGSKFTIEIPQGES